MVYTVKDKEMVVRYDDFYADNGLSPKWVIPKTGKGGWILFLKREGKYKKYSKISGILYICTLIVMLFAITSKIIYGANTNGYIVWLGIVLIASGTIVDAIPDFLERDFRKMILSIIVVLCLIIVGCLA